MISLENRVRTFQQVDFPRYQRQFEKLAEGQQPHTLFITCSDSRILPHLLIGAEPGELFVVRNAGNIIPKSDDAPDTGGVAASIEYAVNALRVSNVVVCGHSHCGAMQGLLQPKLLEALPATGRWVQQSRTVAAKVEGLPQDEQLPRAIHENVILQLEHLRSHSSVREAEKQGRLSVRGWVYEFETGQVFELDESAGEFIPLVAPDVETGIPENSSSIKVSMT